jgi:hypothetical protein
MGVVVWRGAIRAVVYGGGLLVMISWSSFPTSWKWNMSKHERLHRGERNLKIGIVPVDHGMEGAA